MSWRSHQNRLSWLARGSSSTPGQVTTDNTSTHPLPSKIMVRLSFNLADNDEGVFPSLWFHILMNINRLIKSLQTMTVNPFLWEQSRGRFTWPSESLLIINCKQQLSKLHSNRYAHYDNFYSFIVMNILNWLHTRLFKSSARCDNNRKSNEMLK